MKKLFELNLDFNLWDVLTKYLPELKEEILARDGKLVKETTLEEIRERLNNQLC